jgi:hypothetical protein
LPHALITRRGYHDKIANINRGGTSFYPDHYCSGYCHGDGFHGKQFIIGVVMTENKLVILESPFAGDQHDNVIYGRKCLKDSLMRGEHPIASHLLYTLPGVLDDNIPEERTLGIKAGLAWLSVAQASVVYCDKGISLGMHQGIRAARSRGLPIYFRKLDLDCPYFTKEDLQIHKILTNPIKNYAPWPDDA